MGHVATFIIRTIQLVVVSLQVCIYTHAKKKKGHVMGESTYF